MNDELRAYLGAFSLGGNGVTRLARTAQAALARIDSLERELAEARQECERLRGEYDALLEVACLPDMSGALRLFRERAEKAEADLDGANGCLIMVMETLKKLGCKCGPDSHEATPPMMYPEWIACVVRSAVEKAEAERRNFEAEAAQWKEEWRARGEQRDCEKARRKEAERAAAESAKEVERLRVYHTHCPCGAAFEEGSRCKTCIALMGAESAARLAECQEVLRVFARYADCAGDQHATIPIKWCRDAAACLQPVESASEPSVAGGVPIPERLINKGGVKATTATPAPLLDIWNGEWSIVGPKTNNGLYDVRTAYKDGFCGTICTNVSGWVAREIVTNHNKATSAPLPSKTVEHLTEALIAAARREALEEAAKIAEDTLLYQSCTCRAGAAAAIRKAKGE